jgi:hypothetical protein
MASKVMPVTQAETKYCPLIQRSCVTKECMAWYESSHKVGDQFSFFERKDGKPHAIYDDPTRYARIKSEEVQYSTTKRITVKQLIDLGSCEAFAVYTECD